MKTIAQLRQILLQIDGRGYKAYKQIQGAYSGDSFILFVDHVQGDPFASPSKVRLRVSQAVADFPTELFSNPVRRMALEDFLARRIRAAIGERKPGRMGSGKSGLVTIDAGGQEVLQRTAVKITADFVEARLQVGLPAAGRTVLGRQAAQLLCEFLPEIQRKCLLWQSLQREEAVRFVECVENQEDIRSQLPGRGLVGFVADSAILPRESGISQRPLARQKAIPFQSPEELRVRFELKNPIPSPDGPVHEISGMGIPAGVTLIVGGGYHGKSTLLEALERGVYPHVPGDGREYVITVPGAVKIRAEDGRRIEKVNISPFIDRLPLGVDTVRFCSDNASGSTSQVANILEAMEAGASLLLLDEDTSATNFMIRDARMQALVHKEHEPITPFIDRVRELYERHAVSTILVMGGSGDYFDVADTVIMMREYLPADVTAQAKTIAERLQTNRKVEQPAPFQGVTQRIPLPHSFDASRGKREVKIDVRGLETLLFGSETVDLRHVEQLVDPSQTRAVGYAIYLAARRIMDGRRPLAEVLDELETFLEQEGLDALAPFRRGEEHPGNFALPRRYEIAAAINRLRSLRVQQK